MIDIPRNDYVQPKEVREDVVEAICKAFLAGKVWSIFHPFDDGNCRTRTMHVSKCNGFFKEKDWLGTKTVTFTGAEMKEAFRVLLSHGYYMFRVWQYGSWMGYVCRKEPFMLDTTRYQMVSDFTDRID